MGLFDFLKPKQTMTAAKQKLLSRPDCDINKTNIIAELFKTPRNKRDNLWRQLFYQNVATAGFASAKPQMQTGPDGFPYFILKTPDINTSFESFCIQNMKDDFLLYRGCGIVFNPGENNSSDWVFTYGDIVNLHLNNEFFSVTEDVAIENIKFTKNVGVIKKAESVMISQPSESYLPSATKYALKIFLQSKAIKIPKLMMLTSSNEGSMVRKLAFNIHPEDYPVTSKLDYLMQQVGWFLPNNYIIVPLSKNSSLANGFKYM